MKIGKRIQFRRYQAGVPKEVIPFLFSNDDPQIKNYCSGSEKYKKDFGPNEDQQVVAHVKKSLSTGQLGGVADVEEDMTNEFK
ncbi:hypothetical protein [Oenococcus sp.]|uniref:hypothetical protein n=1 Tax=Oenococcus sp. TaxID=1979414 RepID=UPI0039ED63C0